MIRVPPFDLTDQYHIITEGVMEWVLSSICHRCKYRKLQSRFEKESTCIKKNELEKTIFFTETVICFINKILLTVYISNLF